ncbi:MAG: 7-carboxy-7-deazaguanine synthase QueE [Selenomonadaceae bacterium]|nr:7-carboxy-7-deazaguanine synthase QueE [Selenomonadaceae bacterium]
MVMNVIEIFSSAQGEGKYIGCRQVFVRLAGCNLNCAYCDTNFSRADFCNVETAAGLMKFSQIKNPTTDEVIGIVKNFCTQVPTHSVSFTGGEPLLSWQFIFDVATALKKVCDVKFFLETNGTLHNELKKVLGVVDIISMDIKFPSVTGKNLFGIHEEFLQTAREKDLYVKAVISQETSTAEFLQAVELVAKISPEILFVIQPVTPFNTVKAAPPIKILNFQALALKILHDVRIIPQTHKFIGNL